jgi:hypothetical protein
LRRRFAIAGAIALGVIGAVLATRGTNEVLRVLPAGSGQSHFTTDLYTQFSSEFTGNWFYLKNDGTQPSGSVALSAVGSPTTQTDTICPSGPNCDSVGSVRLNGTSQSYKTADTASPTGDFSVCALFRADNFDTAAKMLVGKNSNEASNQSTQFYVSTAAQITFLVAKSDASNTSIGGDTLTPGGLYFACGTYDFVSDGASLMKTYLNGVQHGSASSTAVGPPQVAASTYWAVGEEEYAGFRYWLQGNVFAAFMTEKVLSADTIAAMSKAALGHLSGSYGETITVTRTGATSCESENGDALTKLHTNRPCVRKGGLQVYGSATNTVLRSEEIDNAAWSTEVNPGSLTITADAAVAPDGTKTAETIGYPAVAAGQWAMRYQIITGTAASWTGSVYLKKVSGTDSTIKLWWRNSGTGALVAQTNCSVSTTAWTRCSVTGTLTAVAYRLVLGNSEAHTGATSSDIVVAAWGAQAETGSIATPYIRTAGSTATRNADAVSMSNPLASADTQWCMAATVNWPVLDITPSHGILHIGATYAANNSAALALENATGRAQFIIFDNAGGNKIANTISAVTAGIRRFRACNNAGSLSLWVDGVLASGSSGAGTGTITTMPGTIKIGDLNGSAGLAGVISDICISKDLTGCQ